MVEELLDALDDEGEADTATVEDSVETEGVMAIGDNLSQVQ
jgi:hypothetical protein